MIKNILRMGNHTLYEAAKPVTTFDTAELHQLISDLFDTMKANAGVGLAAPQIGVSMQVIVFGFDYSPRYPDEKPVPETVLINPEISLKQDQQNESWEGCLSMRGLRGLVSRHTTIRYQGYDQFGNFYAREASGFHARIVQHEFDHLRGTLMIERIENLKHFGFEEELFPTI